MLQVSGRNVKRVSRGCERVVWFNVGGRRCSTSSATDTQTQSTRRRQLAVEGPSFKDFIEKNAASLSDQVTTEEAVPYINKTDFSGHNRRGSVL